VLRVFVGVVLGGVAGFGAGLLVALAGTMTMTAAADGGSNIVGFGIVAVIGCTAVGILGGALVGVCLATRRSESIAPEEWPRD